MDGNEWYEECACVEVVYVQGTKERTRERDRASDSEEGRRGEVGEARESGIQRIKKKQVRGKRKGREGRSRG